MIKHIPIPIDVLLARDMRRGGLPFRLTVTARIVKDLMSGGAAFQIDNPRTWY